MEINELEEIVMTVNTFALIIETLAHVDEFMERAITWKILPYDMQRDAEQLRKAIKGITGDSN